jgi:thiol-disulfide isomerase/thioredoxin
LQIRIQPLVRVHGSFASPVAGRSLGWCYADVFVPDDLTRPLDFTRLTGCGTNDNRFALSLPVGEYILCANNGDEDWELSLVPPRKLMLTADKLDIDLGVIELAERSGIRYQERQARQRGTLGDYTKHYGKAPPHWHVDEARGVGKDVELSHFKGKWVLLDFWGMSCTVCLAKTMPALIKLYEDHAADRDRFEILSICIDTEGDLATLADLDRQLEPIVANVWGGRKIPFPILLDKTSETWLNFGIPGLGFVLLVDPDGNLCEGDEQTLAEKLKQPTLRTP